LAWGLLWLLAELRTFTRSLEEDPMTQTAALPPLCSAATFDLATICSQRRIASDTELPRIAANILAQVDGQRSLEQVFERAQISVDRGLAVVRKLSELGMVASVPVTPARTPMSRSNSVLPQRPPGREDRNSFERGETLRGLPPLRSPGFTAAEEEFFASEVQPIDECEEPFAGLTEKISLFFSGLFLRLRGSSAL